MITRRKQCFIDNYIITKNARKAAELAGYSPKAAYTTGPRLLRDAQLRDLVEKGIQAQCKALEISKENVIARLWSEGINAQRASDRIAANVAVARIEGYIKEAGTQQVTAVFNDAIMRRLADNMAKVQGESAA